MECDIPEFYRITEPVARKDHECCECNARIKKGEKHFQVTGKWEGEISSFRQHFLCMEACMYIRDHLDDECIPFGTLFEYLGEYLCKGNKYCAEIVPFRKMIAGIKRRERNE